MCALPSDKVHQVSQRQEGKSQSQNSQRKIQEKNNEETQRKNVKHPFPRIHLPSSHPIPQPPYPVLLGHIPHGVMSHGGLLPPSTGFPRQEGSKVSQYVSRVRGVSGQPGLVVSVVPKGTSHWIGRMRFAAVQTSRRVRTWKTITGGGNGRVRLRGTFTTQGFGPVLHYGNVICMIN